MRPNPFKDLPEGFLPAMLIIIAIVLLAVIFVYVLYLKNLQDLLKEVREPNRRMAPGKVWLVMVNFLGTFLALPYLFPDSFPVNEILIVILQYGISIFVLIWNFYMVNKISESIEAEYSSRNLQVERKPTWQIGIVMCGGYTGALLNNVPYLKVIGIISSLVGFVAWIMYWVKTYEYKQKLRSLPLDNSNNDSLIFGNHY